ncbi:MAG: hypothetical protein WBN89_16680 [Prochlorococcaceae cyanobacterium]
MPSPAQQAIEFLALLDKRPSTTYFRTFPAVRGSRGQDKTPRGGADMLGFDAGQLTRENKSGRGVYFVVGNATGATAVNSKTGKPSGCVCAADIASMSVLFIEWDDRPIHWQVMAWQELNLPEPSVMVATGGKSIHYYYRLRQPVDPEIWQIENKRLSIHAGADSTIYNRSRVMRLPGFRHVDKKSGELGALTEIIHVSGNVYDIAEIMACVPKSERCSAPRPTTACSLITRDGPFPPRPLSAIEAAISRIPKRVVGQNTYPTYRNALCGCAAALAEIGLPEAMAAELFAEHWEGGQKQAEQILRSTTTRKAGSLWAIAALHGFDLRRHDLRPTTSRVGGVF